MGVGSTVDHRLLMK